MLLSICLLNLPKRCSERDEACERSVEIVGASVAEHQALDKVAVLEHRLILKLV